MKIVGTLRIITLLLLLPMVAACTSDDDQPQSAESDTTAAAMEGKNDSLRIITLGGSVTETVYALGFGDRVVAVDISSTYPEVATKLPQVGYQRTLSAENVLALRPTLIIASAEAGPPAAIEHLKNSGVNVAVVPAEPTLEGVEQKIMETARVLGVEQKGRALIDSMHAHLPDSGKRTGDESAPRVMFIYARGAGSVHVSGTGTSADLMIRLAGGNNVISEYEGFRPLTAESVVAAAPDVILMPSGGLESVGGIDGVLKTPGIAQTPAGKNRRVIQMDDLYLLGLGPRTGEAVTDLARLLHNEERPLTAKDTTTDVSEATASR